MLQEIDEPQQDQDQDQDPTPLVGDPLMGVPGTPPNFHLEPAVSSMEDGPGPAIDRLSDQEHVIIPLPEISLPSLSPPVTMLDELVQACDSYAADQQH